MLGTGDNTSPQHISTRMQSKKRSAAQYHRDMPRRMRRYLRGKRFKREQEGMSAEIPPRLFFSLPPLLPCLITETFSIKKI